MKVFGTKEFTKAHRTLLSTKSSILYRTNKIQGLVTNTNKLAGKIQHHLELLSFYCYEQSTIAENVTYGPRHGKNLLIRSVLTRGPLVL